MYRIEHYLTDSGKDVFQDWLESLRDRQAQARIAVRLARLSAGNLGDCKPVGDGVWELRLDWGPGYRVYYARAGDVLILLLCGGDKRTQPKDIEQARTHWQHHQERQP